jgi:mono/diheme cytochrome c family protein
MRHLLLTLALAVGLAVSCGGGDDRSTPALPTEELDLNVQPLPPEAVSLGKSIYDQNCASCHGIEGEGQPNWRERGPDDRLPPPPHDSTGHTWHHGDGTLYGIVRDGGLTSVRGVTSGMPAWGDKLSDEEIRAVLTYIKTFWGPRERAYQEAASERDPIPVADP